jgi:hypothetical protein
MPKKTNTRKLKNKKTGKVINLRKKKPTKSKYNKRGSRSYT